MDKFLLGLIAVAICVAFDWQSSAQETSASTKRPVIIQGELENGDVAPDFLLQDVAGENSIRLSHLHGKPVVLVFGSCTCPPFVASLKSVEELHSTFRGRVIFFIVYIREAHPLDGWTFPKNQFQVKSPATVEERRAIAQDFAKRLNVSIPVLVDTIDDHTENAYVTWPNRMFIISADGRIAAKGTAGPRGVANSAAEAAALLDSLLETPN